MSLAWALLATLAVEVPLYVAALVALTLAAPLRAALLAGAVNLLTHPARWWALDSRPPIGRVAAGEIVVWAVEAGVLWLALRREPVVLLVVSAGANAASILAGVLVSAAA
jgi:hypothetical protein